MPHTHTRPKQHVNYSHQLITNVRGTHAHEAYCSCGWVSRPYNKPGEAQWEAKVHRYIEHGQ
jgi:hypothetical protein